jgi:hypothetical protein
VAVCRLSRLPPAGCQAPAANDADAIHHAAPSLLSLFRAQRES